MTDDPKTLVSTDWLAKHLKDPDLRLLDASWYLPDTDRDAKAEYDAAHIPGARFFDIDDISDAIGHPVKYTRIPVDAYINALNEQGVPQEMQWLLRELFTKVDNVKYFSHI